MAAALHVTAALLLAAAMSPSTAHDVRHEADLLQHLKELSSQYGKTVMPRVNVSEAVNVWLRLMPLQLVAVDTAEETLKFTALLLISWEDELLVWDPSEFDGCDYLPFNHELVWTPEVVVHNGAGRWQVLHVDTDVFVHHLSENRSLVMTMWQREFFFTCDFTMRLFPFDEQVCQLQLTATAFRQPVYRISTLADPVKKEALTSLFEPDQEWHLTGFSRRNQTLPFQMPGGTEYNISAFEAEFRICRYANYYVIVVLLPLLLLTVLQLLTYLVPLESGEKTGCGVTVLLSFTVFLLLIDNIVPKTQQTPVIVYFITASMMISAASLIYNCLLLRMHHTCSDTRMPEWMERLVLRCVGRAMGLKSCSNKWQTGAAALERLGLVLHSLCIIVLAAWMQLQYS